MSVNLSVPKIQFNHGKIFSVGNDSVEIILQKSSNFGPLQLTFKKRCLNWKIAKSIIRYGNGFSRWVGLEQGDFLTISFLVEGDEGSYHPKM